MPPKYKPGGKRFPPRVTSKPLPKQVINDNTSVSRASEASIPAASGLDQEAENQFELELCWCVQQLQITVQSGKLPEKQMLDATKTLNLLSSNTVSLIRKRQAMRNTFGDYRAKMIQDEKKHGKYISNVKFSAPKTDSNKCVFLRKVAKAEEDTNKKDSHESPSNVEGKENKKVFVMSKEPSEIPFKFNFSQPESN